MITKLARLEFERFTKPSNFDFLRVHQYLGTLQLKSEHRPDNSNSFFLHIHASKIHKLSLRWNYTFGLGIMCMGLFIILSLTGFLLMIYYKPDTAKAYF